MRGRVTAGADKRPLARVRVSLASTGGEPVDVVTNGRGEFEFKNVSAGRYLVTAARAGFLTTQFGQRHPHEAGRFIDVSAKASIDGIQIALYRGAVLAGEVADELGDPYPGAHVEALEFRYSLGRRRLVVAAQGVSDDRGEFRLSGLQPGTYLLRASSTDLWQADDGRATYAYAITYFPGVVSAGEAQSLSVSAEQTLSALNLRMVAVRSASISGTLRGAEGLASAGQRISLDRVSRGAVGTFSARQAAGTARTDGNGGFAFRGLPPGEFVVSSSSGGERAAQTVIVGDGEDRHVVVTVRKPNKVVGTIVTDDGVPAPFAPSRLQVTPIPASGDESLNPAGPSAAKVTVGWSFEIDDLEGDYLFRVTGLPDGWMVKSVTAAGRDSTDVPLFIGRQAAADASVQIEISRKGGSIQGDVVDRDGVPAPDSTVIVFADSPARWTLGSRYIKASRLDERGHFVIAGLPAGLYRVCAKAVVAQGQWEDPEFLRSLSASAKIEVGESESLILTVKLEEQ